MLTAGEKNLINDILRKECKITNMEEWEEREYYRRELIRNTEEKDRKNWIGRCFFDNLSEYP